jgi:hypothetical protein
MIRWEEDVETKFDGHRQEAVDRDVIAVAVMRG